MPTYRTPDVYVEEISVFPPSVAEVGTAIPAFIGYTERAARDTEGLTLKPTKIYSLAEYELLFGGPRPDSIAVTIADDGAGGFTVTSFTEPATSYLLYYAVKMFFDNGGGQCYIVSVGPLRGRSCHASPRSSQRASTRWRRKTSPRCSSFPKRSSWTPILRHAGPGDAHAVREASRPLRHSRRSRGHGRVVHGQQQPQHQPRSLRQ